MNSISLVREIELQLQKWLCNFISYKYLNVIDDLPCLHFVGTKTNPKIKRKDSIVSFVHICLPDDMSCLHILLAGKLIPRKDSVVAHVHISLPSKHKQALPRQVVYSEFVLLKGPARS